MRSLRSAAGVMVVLEPEQTLEALPHLPAADGSDCGNLLLKRRDSCDGRHSLRPPGGNQGEGVVVLAAQTVSGGSLGVLGTALIQSLLGGLGVVVAGVPAPMLFTAVMFILGIAQLGPVFVLIPSVIWLYYSDQNIWGTILLVWTYLSALLTTEL